MNYAIIFHGTGGHAEENWFPWIKNELKKYGYEVIIPQFPTIPKYSLAEGHTQEKWFAVFKNYEKFINKKTILIGHSLGGGFLLRVLEKLKSKVKAAIFVAPSVGVKPIKYYETDKPFVKAPFDWKKIKQSSKHFIVFHSKNDPFICIGNGEKLAEKFGVKLIRVKNAGHFNATSGYIKFDLLLEKLKEII